MGRSYYMLVGSLPHLPHFLRAERLPINEQRLRWRRNALEPEDYDDLERAVGLLGWRHDAPHRTSAEINQQFGRFMQDVRNPVMKEFADYRMGLRSAIAGLRRKQQGEAAPTGEDRCGVGRWNRLIADQWDRELFGMVPLFPCLTQVREHLTAGRPAQVEEAMMREVWFRLSRIEDTHPLRFEALFAYVFKWDILRRWLARDDAEATRHFEQLIQEVIHEQTVSLN